MTITATPHPKPVATTPAPTSAPATALTALDRCDRCGAQALLAFENPGVVVNEPTEDPFDAQPLPASGTVAGILLCAHHGRKHGDALGVQGFIITTDQTHLLDAANNAFKGLDPDQD